MARRHVFLTGQPGVGKSTLCQRVVQHTEEMGWAGFYTAELRDERGERIGFDIVTLDGARGPLARIGKGRGTTVGKYTVDLNSFGRLALPALKVSTSTTLLLIDEIGKMELSLRAFFPAVREAMDSPSVVVLGTIPAPKEGRVFSEVAEVVARADVEVIPVTRSNRDNLLQEIVAKLRQNLNSVQRGRVT